MSKKSDFISRLFSADVPYESQPVRKTEILSVVSDDSGKSVVQTFCVEDVMAKQIALNYQDVTLSNLVSKGVEPKALDMIDSCKLGVDEGIDRLAQHLVNNTDKYVQSSKSE